MDLGIKGKTALVVAASKGMGKASALGLAATTRAVLPLMPRSMGTPLSDCANQDVCL